MLGFLKLAEDLNNFDICLALEFLLYLEMKKIFVTIKNLLLSPLKVCEYVVPL